MLDLQPINMTREPFGLHDLAGATFAESILRVALEERLAKLFGGVVELIVRVTCCG